MDEWLFCFFTLTVNLIPTGSLPFLLSILSHSCALVLESTRHPTVFTPTERTLPLPLSGHQVLPTQDLSLPLTWPGPKASLWLQAGPEFPDTVAAGS